MAADSTSGNMLGSCVLLVISVVIIQTSTTSACPHKCQCSHGDMMTCTGLTSFPWPIATTIKKLRLSRGQISHWGIATGPVVRLPSNLEALSVTSNKLTSVQPMIFARTPNLNTVHLSNNNIRALPARLFANTPKLKRLFLNFNQLRTLPAGLFDTTTSLEILSLTHNPITMLPAGIFDNLPNMPKDRVDLDLAKIPRSNLCVLGPVWNALDKNAKAAYHSLSSSCFHGRRLRCHTSGATVHHHCQCQRPGYIYAGRANGCIPVASCDQTDPKSRCYGYPMCTATTGSTGICTCPAGYKLENGKCTLLPTRPTTPRPSVATTMPQRPITKTTTQKTPPVTTTQHVVPTTTKPVVPTTTQRVIPTTTQQAVPTTSQRVVPTTTQRKAVPTTTLHRVVTRARTKRPPVTATASPKPQVATPPGKGSMVGSTGSDEFATLQGMVLERNGQSQHLLTTLRTILDQIQFPLLVNRKCGVQYRNSSGQVIRLLVEERVNLDNVGTFLTNAAIPGLLNVQKSLQAKHNDIASARKALTAYDQFIQQILPQMEKFRSISFSVQREATSAVKASHEGQGTPIPTPAAPSAIEHPNAPDDTNFPPEEIIPVGSQVDADMFMARDPEDDHYHSKESRPQDARHPMERPIAAEAFHNPDHGYHHKGGQHHMRGQGSGHGEGRMGQQLSDSEQHRMSGDRYEDGQGQTQPHRSDGREHQMEGWHPEHRQSSMRDNGRHVGQGHHGDDRLDAALSHRGGGQGPDQGHGRHGEDGFGGGMHHPEGDRFGDVQGHSGQHESGAGQHSDGEGRFHHGHDDTGGHGSDQGHGRHGQDGFEAAMHHPERERFGDVQHPSGQHQSGAGQHGHGEGSFHHGHDHTGGQRSDPDHGRHGEDGFGAGMHHPEGDRFGDVQGHLGQHQSGAGQHGDGEGRFEHGHDHIGEQRFGAGTRHNGQHRFPDFDYPSKHLPPHDAHWDGGDLSSQDDTLLSKEHHQTNHPEGFSFDAPTHPERHGHFDAQQHAEASESADVHHGPEWSGHDHVPSFTDGAQDQISGESPDIPISSDPQKGTFSHRTPDHDRKHGGNRKQGSPMMPQDVSTVKASRSTWQAPTAPPAATEHVPEAVSEPEAQPSEVESSEQVAPTVHSNLPPREVHPGHANGEPEGDLSGLSASEFWHHEMEGPGDNTDTWNGMNHEQEELPHGRKRRDMTHDQTVPDKSLTPSHGSCIVLRNQLPPVWDNIRV